MQARSSRTFTRCFRFVASVGLALLFLTEAATAFLQKASVSRAINMSDAEGRATGNRRAYFRKSPSVSSDVLMALTRDLAPSEHDLMRGADSHVRSFPDEDIDRLRRHLAPE